MFRKSDILPLILALISTVLIVGMGFTWLKSNNIAGFGNNDLNQKKILQTSNTQTQPTASSASSAAGNQGKFVVPVIVPQGTSVSINGFGRLNQINIALRKSFHQHYPGTVITTNANNSDVGLKLLSAGNIDLLALDRPLSSAETALGLTAVKINDSGSKADVNFYYVYKEPLNPDTEIFIGYALSVPGKEAITHY